MGFIRSFSNKLHFIRRSDVDFINLVNRNAILNPLKLKTSFFLVFKKFKKLRKFNFLTSKLNYIKKFFLFNCTLKYKLIEKNNCDLTRQLVLFKVFFDIFLKKIFQIFILKKIKKLKLIQFFYSIQKFLTVDFLFSLKNLNFFFNFIFCYFKKILKLCGPYYEFKKLIFNNYLKSYNNTFCKKQHLTNLIGVHFNL